jgi:hypothetical protein
VTKPTGRPRCRPPKASKTDKPKKEVGRPKGTSKPLKLLAADPDRYFLAFVQYHIDQGELHGKQMLAAFR